MFRVCSDASAGKSHDKLYLPYCLRLPHAHTFLPLPPTSVSALYLAFVHGAHEFPPSTDAHLIAATLKMSFRALCEPLFTFDAYDRMLAAGGTPSDEAAVYMIGVVLSLLPPENL